MYFTQRDFARAIADFAEAVEQRPEEPLRRPCASGIADRGIDYFV